ncbi:MAG: NAD(P)H-hydrate dehydratase, partial [Hyphomicrobiales bacterium]
QRLKPAHLLATSAPLGMNTLSIVDLGIEKFEPDQDETNIIHMSGMPPNLYKQNLAHKYEHGHAVVLSGGVGKGGAGRLAAHAALRIGAGAVTLACPTAAVPENAAQLNAVMLAPLDGSKGLDDLLCDTRKNSICLGPAMGVNDRTKEMVLTALYSKRHIVLDADALTSFAMDSSTLFQATHPGCVLTPHEGEFARLFPDLTEKTSLPNSASSKIDMVRAASIRADCVVLLKGAVTIIGCPTGQVKLSAALAERSAPWLATAGSGDVLAGFITGFMARGFDPMSAASAGVWLHVECAKIFGPGLIAEDLSNMVPRVLSEWDCEQRKGKTAQ